jgi:DNA-binding response OmpR family regulator
MQDGKYVVLCIDDDPDILDSLSIILEANGYICQGATTAEEGVQVFREARPDLVIVDLMMEEIDAGTNLVRELRLLGSDVPVYMLSSVGDSLSQMTDYTELGLAGVLQKPIAPDALLALLKERLG